jgi:hypothetical protein
MLCLCILRYQRQMVTVRRIGRLPARLQRALLSAAVRGEPERIARLTRQGLWCMTRWTGRPVRDFAFREGKKLTGLEFTTASLFLHCLGRFLTAVVEQRLLRVWWPRSCIGLFLEWCGRFGVEARVCDLDVVDTGTFVRDAGDPPMSPLRRHKAVLTLLSRADDTVPGGLSRSRGPR